jgi:hypothetical protein
VKEYSAVPRSSTRSLLKEDIIEAIKCLKAWWDCGDNFVAMAEPMGADETIVLSYHPVIQSGPGNHFLPSGD